MELSSQEDHENIPIPINTSYDHHPPHGHIIHHHHPHPTSPPNNSQTLVNTHENEDLHHHHHHPNQNSVVKKQTLLNVKYKECLKNHAASMGGNAIDGCGEFMPSGEEGSIEALICSVCGCHRNFHRREVEGDKGNFLYNSNSATTKKLMLTHHHHHKGLVRSAVPSQMIMPSYGYNYMGGGGGAGVSRHPYILPNSESEDQMDLDEVSAARPVNSQAPAGTQLIGINHHHHCGGGGQTAGVMMMAAAVGNSKKRFRTKFTAEQKERMLEFAERIGWKIQRQEESVVQQFCQDVGVKRRVLKVWMHNNKHNLAKKNINNEDNNNDNNNNINNNSVSISGNNTANLASSA